MKVVIVGCGRVGAQLAKSLDADGHMVTMVDSNSNSIYRLQSEFNGKFVVGNGFDEDVLAQAGIEKADVVTAVTDKDNTNIMVAQIAKILYQVPKVVARVNDPDNTETFTQLGLETAGLTSLCADFLKQALV